MNRNKNIPYQIISAFFFLGPFVIYVGSCKPVIKSFKVTIHDTTQARKMTADDTLRVNWTVKGKPTLLVTESELTGSPARMLEMKLIVEKGGKEVNQAVQVEVLPKNSTTSITFNTEAPSGDTLIAQDHKDPGVWGDRFEIVSVSNASNRPLTVTHANRTVLLDKAGSPSGAFSGTPVEGRWVFKTLLTDAEKADHSLLPERLQINAIITYKKR